MVRSDMLPVIDVHAHDIPVELLGELRRRGADFGARLEDHEGEWFIAHAQGYRYPLATEFFDVERRLADMGSRGISLTVLSPSPTFFGYEMDAGAAAEMATIINDGTASMVRRGNGRLAGMATLPLQDTRRALQELERSVMAHGFRAIEVGSHVAGMPLSDPSLREIWARVQELDLLVFVHPYYTGVKPRMERFYLTNLIGNPFDTALAVADVCFSGMLDEMPGLKLLFAHGGGFMPYQVGRLRHGFKVRDEPKVATTRSPEETFRMLYFDTITHDAAALRYLVSSVSAAHVCLGSDLPFDMADEQPLATVQAAGLDPSDLTRIAGGNLRDRFQASEAGGVGD